MTSIRRLVAVAAQGREVIPFEATREGPITARISWSGGASSLALILNGPGRTNYFARQDGGAPLTLSYSLTAQDLANGPGWRLSVVNFSSQETSGISLELDYPEDARPQLVSRGSVSTVSLASSFSSGPAPLPGPARFPSPLPKFSPARAGAAPMLDIGTRRTIEASRATALALSRSALHLPTLISPSAVVTDQTILENPDNSSQHYYIGSFRLATRREGNRPFPWVELRPTEEGAGVQLEVHLERLRPPAAPADAEPVSDASTTLRCLISATVNGSIRNWEFSDISKTKDSWTLSLRLQAEPLLAERRALYSAMTQSPDSKLVIQHVLNVASQTETAHAAELSMVREGFLGVLRARTGPVGRLVRPVLRAVADPAAVGGSITAGPAPMPPRIIPHLPPGFVGDPSAPVLDPMRYARYKAILSRMAPGDPARQRLAASLLRHLPQGDPRREEILSMLSLDATNSPERSVPGEALYARSNATVESCLDFRFDKDLDRSVFAKLTGIPGTADSGWNHLQVPWQPDPSKPPRDHFYFQDRMDATAVYFLPDEFRIKRDEASHLPLLSVSVLGDGSRLSLSYVAVPVWDPKRIEAALPQLQRVGVPREVTALRLFAAGNATLRLKLPNGDPQGGPGLVDQSKASVQTDLAISGNVNLAKDDFAAVFRDLLTSASGYLSGEVVVVVDEHTIRLPFVSRATQFVGEVLEVAVDYASATALKLTARNVIESPVVIKKLPILLQRNDKEVALRSSSPTPALPVTLAPANEEHPIGEEVELLLESTDGSLNGTLLYDLSQVTVEVDGDALFNCILDQTLAVHQTRELQINILASLLPPPPSPQAQVNVEVELLGSSGVVIFTSGAPPEGSLFFAKSLLLQIPLRELLLGKTHAAELQNRYRLRYFTAAGPERTGDWIPLKVDEQVLYLSTLPKEGA